MKDHTPTPWKYHLGRGKYPRFHIQTDGGYQIVCTPKLDSLSKEENVGREKDAAFIVLAVNSHEALLGVVKEALCWLDPDCRYDGVKLTEDSNDKEVIIGALYEAIAQAEAKYPDVW